MGRAGRTNPGVLVLVAAVATALLASSAVAQTTLDSSIIQDRIKGGWVGQMAGVCWGAPVEFRYSGMIPDANVPSWQPSWINGGFDQDDLYVEMPFIQAMQTKGVNCTWTDFGNSFAQTTFPLWHANGRGRADLLAGIPTPYSGHYSNNSHADDIDWQIEADFAGMVNPGQVNAAMDVAWRGGHVMNYGDGVYGGVAVAAMHAAAFTATSLGQVIEAGRSALPIGSEYRMAVDDAIANYNQGFTWQQNWTFIDQKYHLSPTYTNHSCPQQGWPLDIDAKLNGAFVFLGLLYSQNANGSVDMERAMRIAMQCGQDSDCNPSTVGGIIGNYLGYSQIPDKFKSGLSSTMTFTGTSLTLDGAVSATYDLAEKSVAMTGGFSSGPTWTVPDRPEQPIVFEQWPNVANPAPVLTASVNVLPSGKLQCQASATDTDGIREYQWFFGDLSFAAGASAAHTYVAPGSYQVICYVADPTGNTSWKSFQIQAGPHAGDADGSGAVDVVDLGILAKYYDTASGATWQMGDFSGDGAVDVVDLGILAKNYDWTAGSGQVPEPAGLTLLALGALAAIRRKR